MTLTLPALCPVIANIAMSTIAAPHVLAQTHPTLSTEQTAALKEAKHHCDELQFFQSLLHALEFWPG